MANATLVQIRDLIRVKRPELFGNTKFPNPVINEFINQAQRFVQLNLAHLGIKEWEATDSLTLSSGTFGTASVKTAPLATDCPNRLFDDERVIKYIDCSNSGGGATDKGIAHYVDDSIFEGKIRNALLAPTDNEPIFTRYNQLLVIYPNTIDTATAHYYKQVTDMTSDSNNTEIPEMYEEYIVKRALIDVDDVLGKLQNKQASMQQLITDLQQTFQSQGLATQSEPKGEVV